MGWLNASWPTRFPVTVQASQVPGDVTSPTLMFDLSRATAAFWSTVKSDGGDIRFTKADGTTELPFEVVGFDYAGNAGMLFARESGTLSSSSNTEYKVYCGNSGASAYGNTDTYGRNNAWQDHAGAWHLQTSSYVDSTGSNDLTATGTPTLVTGQSGKGADISGTGQYWEIGASHWSSATKATYSCWFNPDTISSGYRYTFSQRGSGSDYFQSYISPTGELWFSVAGGWVYKSSLLTANTWHHVVYVYDGTLSGNTNRAKVYLDGSQVTGMSSGGTVPASLPAFMGEFLHIGARGDGTNLFDGTLDECYAWEDAWTADEVSVLYNNQNAESSFNTWGTQENNATSDQAAALILSAV